MEITVPDLIKQLNDATKAYDEGHPIMSDKEWDNLYFALLKYETEGGIIFPDSPTQKVNYEVVNKLINNMINLLTELQKDYKDNIDIRRC